MSAPNNQINNWVTNQLVTSGQMNRFSEDLYYKIGFLTDATNNYNNNGGCIIDLPSVTQSGGNVDLSAGSFRFPNNSSLTFLLYIPPLIANAPAATVAVSGNGYIVAQYTVMPNISNQYEYVFNCTYAFVASVGVNDVLIVGITGGLINNNQWGTYANNPVSQYIPPINHYQTTISVAPISGNAPQSILLMAPDNSYTQNNLIITNGVSGDSGNVFMQYADGGNGTFKPAVQLSTQEPTASSNTGFFIAPSGSDSGYLGFYSAHSNKVTVSSENLDGTQEFYYNNTTGNMFSSWYVQNTSTSVRSGIEMSMYARPSLLGNVSAQALQGDATIAAFGDFPFSATDVGYQKLPGGMILQWVTFSIANRGTQSVTFAIPFPNNVLSIVTGSQPSALDLTHGYDIVVTAYNTTGATFAAPSTSGDTSVYPAWAFIIGN